MSLRWSEHRFSKVTPGSRSGIPWTCRKLTSPDRVTPRGSRSAQVRVLAPARRSYAVIVSSAPSHSSVFGSGHSPTTHEGRGVGQGLNEPSGSVRRGADPSRRTRRSHTGAPCIRMRVDVPRWGGRTPHSGAISKARGRSDAGSCGGNGRGGNRGHQVSLRRWHRRGLTLHLPLDIRLPDV